MNDQYIIPLFVAGSLLLALFAFFLIAYLLVQKRKQNRYQLEKQRMVFDHENNLLRTKIEEQEHTMDQISKEIHDNTKSLLGFAQMSMYGIADMATDDNQTALIENTNKILGQVIDDLHNISHSLNSNFIRNIGLTETITKELEQMSMSRNITHDLAITGDVVPLAPETELHIYRIMQEAIQNCLKHARASNIEVALNYEPKQFTLQITDNGTGFDKNKVFQMKGLGFLNMYQRARYVHGAIDVQSAPNEGSTITLTINLDEHGANY